MLKQWWTIPMLLGFLLVMSLLYAMEINQTGVWRDNATLARSELEATQGLLQSCEHSAAERLRMIDSRIGCDEGACWEDWQAVCKRREYPCEFMAQELVECRAQIESPTSDQVQKLQYELGICQLENGVIRSERNMLTEQAAKLLEKCGK